MSVVYTDLGRIAYADALERQTAAFEALLRAKAAGGGSGGRLFFCEHLPVITIGRSGKEGNLLVSEALLSERGISLYRVSRGGDITYHGPGQITGYPVLDLDCWRMGLKQYVHTLEETVIRFLTIYGIRAGRLDGAAGVWLDAHRTDGRARKICAIGVRSSRYVTMHGFALNINTDISCFSLINPCGFTDRGVTSLANELGAPQDFELAKEQMRDLLMEAFPPVHRL
ncbi:MAG: lipoyl(octanoyl) transferase LipB [Tannerellaceae bacterium]|jgi:lipoyl(octanoyl) transferase|nr:lipoyl(octanoyl) transferase LipB [Tannerellaceae bacterium]